MNDPLFWPLCILIVMVAIIGALLIFALTKADDLSRQIDAHGAALAKRIEVGVRNVVDTQHIALRSVAELRKQFEPEKQPKVCKSCEQVIPGQEEVLEAPLVRILRSKKG